MQPINNKLIRIKNNYCKQPDTRNYPDIIPWPIKVLYSYTLFSEEVISVSDRMLDPYNLKSYHAENY